MNYFIKFKIFLVLLLLINPFSKLHSETTDMVAAVVNDEVITLYDLNQAESLISLGAPSELVLTKKDILDILIDEKLFAKEAENLGITADEGEIELAVEDLLKQNQWSEDQLRERLAEFGLDMEKYKKQISNEIKRYKFINKEIKPQVSISENDILGYYNRNKQDFRLEESVWLKHIFFEVKEEYTDEEIVKVEETAENVLKKLHEGDDFSQLAKEYSQGPAAEDGGDLGYVKRKFLLPELAEVVFGLEKNSLSGIIKSSKGYHIVKVMDKQVGEVQPLDDVRNQIQMILYQQKVEKLFIQRMKDLRERSVIEIRL